MRHSWKICPETGVRSFFKLPIHFCIPDALNGRVSVPAHSEKPCGTTDRDRVQSLQNIREHDAELRVVFIF